jgi:hypothetical protein
VSARERIEQNGRFAREKLASQQVDPNSCQLVPVAIEADGSARVVNKPG